MEACDLTVDQTVGRCLDRFDIASGLVKRWQPDAERKNEQ
jgi:3-polyprenyl-4-hydroxybenzoate decarboxylase